MILVACIRGDITILIVYGVSIGTHSRTANEISLQIKDILQAVPNTQDFEALMGKANIKTLATMPPQNGIIKFFMYAQEADSGDFHLLEVCASQPGPHIVRGVS